MLTILASCLIGGGLKGLFTPTPKLSKILSAELRKELI